MPFFARIFELVASLGGFIYGLAGFAQLRLLLSLLALGAAIGLIIYWLYLEKRYGWGRWWWGLLFNHWAEARFLAKKKAALAREWRRLQGVFEADKLKAVAEAELFFNEILNLYFDKEKPLKVRLDKLSPKLIGNLDRFKLAVEAIDLLKQKIKSGVAVAVSEAEAKAIMQEFERALISMLVISEEDQWVDKA